MTEAIWEVRRKCSKKHINAFSEYDAILVQLLYNRGLKTQADVDEFFNPDFDQDLHDPYLFTDMERAVQRILEAVKNKEKVAIYGDYDADGVTASSILTELFRALGLSGQIYIPDRKNEGYGLNKKSIEWLYHKKIDLIVTCDCGVSSRKEIDYAKDEYDIDVVVLDHHHLPENFSKDYIVVDAKRKGDKYPFKELCAAGVTFKLAEAFYRHERKYLKAKNKEAFLKWLLDLVAIGTVADCVPLFHENRTLVQYGLTVLSKTKRIGIQEIFKKAGISNEAITSYHLGYLVGPRINAAGRIDHANVGYQLLTSKNRTEAAAYAEKLEKTNTRRQNLTEKVLEEALCEIKKRKKLEKIIVIGKHWPQGVLGIVAGKLTEKYSRPVIVFTIPTSEDRKKGQVGCVGSGRGPVSFNLVKAIAACKKDLEEYGGHQQAAGLTVTYKKYNKFKESIEKFAATKLKEKDLVPKISIDAKISLGDVNWDFEKSMSKMNPFGEGNPEPRFLTEKLAIVTIMAVGKKSNHLKMVLEDQKGNQKNAIAFSFGDKIKDFRIGDLIDVVFSFSINEWNGNRNLELRVVDMKKSKQS
ncbi:single-stranded-DNA-specific exonuclease RecJ [Patescibacteria group bacterium]|nr:single-stranded-DNA-specific exonuclease RecJ [Patescibacteria group bacterium]